MKLIKTEDAVGQVLCHDMTQIIPGKYKGARFRKGHIVTKEDIPVLLSMGKENLFVFALDENMLHENDAAEILCKANPEIDAELAQASQQYLTDPYQAEAEQRGLIHAERWNRFYQFINENKLAEEEIPMDVGFTNDYL